jgi:hypothetical protein
VVGFRRRSLAHTPRHDELERPWPSRVPVRISATGNRSVSSSLDDTDPPTRIGCRTEATLQNERQGTHTRALPTVFRRPSALIWPMSGRTPCRCLDAIVRSPFVEDWLRRFGRRSTVRSWPSRCAAFAIMLLYAGAATWMAVVARRDPGRIFFVGKHGYGVKPRDVSAAEWIRRYVPGDSEAASSPPYSGCWSRHSRGDIETSASGSCLRAQNPQRTLLVLWRPADTGVETETWRSSA